MVVSLSCTDLKLTNKWQATIGANAHIATKHGTANVICHFEWHCMCYNDS